MKQLNLLICIIVLMVSTELSFAQANTHYKIIRSNLGSSGSSQTVSTSKGIYKVSQSIGQSSVIGTYKKSGYYLLQGYQQPWYKINVIKGSEYEILAKVYPNPFQQSISIAFSSIMEYPISVMIFDLHGKIIYRNEFLPAQNLELNLIDISSGSYFLKILSNGSHFNAKLIKF